MRRLNALSAIVLVTAALSLSTRLSGQAPLHEGITRTVYVSVLSKSGAPVTDLGDDNGTGIFRYAVAKFIERLQGRAEFGLSTVPGQHQKLLDYTANLDRISPVLNQLSARPATNDGGQLLEGIFETAKDLQKRRVPRPIIVVLTVGGEEHSTLPAHHVLEELEKR